MAEVHITIDETNNQFAIQFKDFKQVSLPIMFTGIATWIMDNAKGDVEEARQLMIDSIKEIKFNKTKKKYKFPILQDKDITPLSSNG